MKGKNKAKNSMMKQSSIKVKKNRIFLLDLFLIKQMMFVTRPTMYRNPVKNGSSIKGEKRIKPLEATVKKKKAKIKIKLKIEYIIV